MFGDVYRLRKDKGLTLMVVGKAPLTAFGTYPGDTYLQCVTLRPDETGDLPYDPGYIGSWEVLNPHSWQKINDDR